MWQKDYSEVIENPMLSRCHERSARRCLESMRPARSVRSILPTRDFKNTVVHEPKLLKLLPGGGRRS